MRLLQSEVLIVPGRSAQYPQGASVIEGQPIPGAAVVRLTNTTPRENAFKVRVRCSDHYWQEDWVHPIALPPLSGADNVIGGKPDQRGPQGQWVKVYVPRDGSRDILLRFQVPQTPNARAGRYPFVVEIETQVMGAGEGITRRSRVIELPGTAYIAPFYSWSVDISPPQQNVGITRHSSEFAVVVTNEGNDWLYCDLELPRPTNMLLEAPTLRVAMPPPEPGELLPTEFNAKARIGTQRSVPLRATSQLRNLGGLATLQPIALTATRVDAPSVVMPSGNSDRGSIVMQETAEQALVPGNRGLMYRPPIPSSLSMLFDRTGNAFQSAIIALVGLGALALVVLVLEENYRFNGIQIEPQPTDGGAKEVNTKQGQLLRFKGKKLEGAKITLGGVQLDFQPNSNLLYPYSLTVPKTMKDGVAALKAQRSLSYLPFLDAFLPHTESPIEIKINVPGEEKKEQDANEKRGKEAKVPNTPPSDTKDPGTPLLAAKNANPKIPIRNDPVMHHPATPLSLPKNANPKDPTSTKPEQKEQDTQPPGADVPTLLKLFNHVRQAPSTDIRSESERLITIASRLIPNDKQQNAMAWAVQGYLLVQIQQENKGNAALLNSRKIDSDNFLALSGQGLLAYQQALQPQCKDKRAALELAGEYLESAIAKNPYAALPHYLLGRVYLQQGKSDKALLQAQAAIDGEDPKMAAAYQLLGQIYAQLGNKPGAQEAYDTARKKDPNLPQLAEDINKLNGN